MASRNTSFHDGALARVLLAPFKLGFALTLGLAGLLLVAWTVDWVFVAHVWPGRQRLPFHSSSANSAETYPTPCARCVRETSPRSTWRRRQSVPGWRSFPATLQ